MHFRFLESLQQNIDLKISMFWKKQCLKDLKYMIDRVRNLKNDINHQKTNIALTLL